MLLPLLLLLLLLPLLLPLLLLLLLVLLLPLLLLPPLTPPLLLSVTAVPPCPLLASAFPVRSAPFLVFIPLFQVVVFVFLFRAVAVPPLLPVPLLLLCLL